MVYEYTTHFNIQLVPWYPLIFSSIIFFVADLIPNACALGLILYKLLGYGRNTAITLKPQH